MQLPYCEGLEIVSAAAVQQRPELMGAGGPGLGGGAPAATAAGAPEPAGADVRQRPGRSFVPGAVRLPEEGLDLNKLQER